MTKQTADGNKERVELSLNGGTNGGLKNVFRNHCPKKSELMASKRFLVGIYRLSENITDVF